MIPINLSLFSGRTKQKKYFFLSKCLIQSLNYQEWRKDLDDVADTVADIGPDHHLRETLHRLLLYHLQKEVGFKRRKLCDLLLIKEKVKFKQPV